MTDILPVIDDDSDFKEVPVVLLVPDPKCTERNEGITMERISKIIEMIFTKGAHKESESQFKKGSPREDHKMKRQKTNNIGFLCKSNQCSLKKKPKFKRMKSLPALNKIEINEKKLKDKELSKETDNIVKLNRFCEEMNDLLNIHQSMTWKDNSESRTERILAKLKEENENERISQTIMKPNQTLSPFIPPAFLSEVKNQIPTFPHMSNSRASFLISDFLDGTSTVRKKQTTTNWMNAFFKMEEENAFNLIYLHTDKLHSDFTEERKLDEMLSKKLSRLKDRRLRKKAKAVAPCISPIYKQLRVNNENVQHTLTTFYNKFFKIGQPLSGTPTYSSEYKKRDPNNSNNQDTQEFTHSHTHSHTNSHTNSNNNSNINSHYTNNSHHSHSSQSSHSQYHAQSHNYGSHQFIHNPASSQNVNKNHHFLHKFHHIIIVPNGLFSAFKCEFVEFELKEYSNLHRNFLMDWFNVKPDSPRYSIRNSTPLKVKEIF